MAVKFRNGLLGFNKDDVMKYVYSVKEIEIKNNEKIAELQSEAAKLSEELQSANASLSDLKAENAVMSQRLADFERREAEITRLSESIGKLYLVAKANARTIVNAAKENVYLSRSTVELNMSTAETASAELSDIETELLATAERFTAELSSIKQKLFDAKLKITDNDAVIDNKEAVLDTLMESVNA